jgi:hypothetical protein
MPRLLSSHRCSLAAMLLGALVCAPALAGKVDVTFVEPEQFVDAGRNAVDRERHLRTLAAHLQAAGERLPAGQVLTVEVTDVDLAGTQDHFRFNEVRVLRGRADWPRMSLRWTLQRADGSRTQGEERLADMGYLMTSSRLNPQEALGFERRMLDRWLVERFGVAER